MREIRLHGSEGGGARTIGPPYPYRSSYAAFGTDPREKLRSFFGPERREPISTRAIRRDGAASTRRTIGRADT